MSNQQHSPEFASAEHWYESSLESVDAAEETAVDFARRAGLNEDDQHGLGMAVRESMVNAVVHGNRYSADRRVHVTMSAQGGELRIQILDEGEGFDPNRVSNPLAPENLLRQSGRGMLLIRAFVDDFSIERAEPKGTKVTLIKKMPVQ